MPNESKPAGQVSADDPLRITVEDLARKIDKAPWIIARSLANLIERGLLAVEDGTPAQAAAKLRDFASNIAKDNADV